jgi:general secretion pathway protein K
MHPPGNNKRSDSNGSRAGSALIVVMWVLGLLALFVLGFAFEMQLEARVTSAWRKQLKAGYLAKAGVELARMALLETADPTMNNTEPEAYLAKGQDEKLRYAVWGLAHGSGVNLERKLGEGTLSVSIQPENARMNINSMINIADRDATYKAWESVFENAAVPKDRWDGLVDCLIDWVDPNELSHLNGAESQYYESLSPPYQSKNRPLATVDELIMIKGFNELLPESNRTVYDAIPGYLTMYSEDAKVNINAVTRDTLMAVLNIDVQTAEEIIRERTGPDGQPGTEDDRPFKDLNDLLARIPVLGQAVADRISFSPMGRFTILARGKVGDLERVIICVVRLSNKQITILNWFEGLPEECPISS